MAGQFDELADWIEEKWNSEAVIPEVLEHRPDLSVLDAYHVQAVRMARHVAQGDRIIGYKAALTSKAMQRQVGIDEPILGTLLGSRTYPEDSPLSLGAFMVPTLEPEVAVLLKGDLTGPGVTPHDAMAAIEGYLPAVEIGDIRTGDNERSLQQTILCNTFNGGHIFGPPLSAPGGIDLRREGMVLYVNGEIAGSATAAEVLGDPINSVVFMANKLGEIGLGLKAGMVLMTGSIVASVKLKAGDEVFAAFTRLGEVRVRCVA